jgi:hypothetical protein
MGSHGGVRHQNKTTLRAKLALEIPAVPLEVFTLDSLVPCVLISRGSGDGAGQLPGCWEA